MDSNYGMSLTDQHPESEPDLWQSSLGGSGKGVPSSSGDRGQRQKGETSRLQALRPSPLRTVSGQQRYPMDIIPTKNLPNPPRSAPSHTSSFDANNHRSVYSQADLQPQSSSTASARSLSPSSRCGTVVSEELHDLSLLAQALSGLEGPGTTMTRTHPSTDGPSSQSPGRRSIRPSNNSQSAASVYYKGSPPSAQNRPPLREYYQPGYAVPTRSPHTRESLPLPHTVARSQTGYLSGATSASSMTHAPRQAQAQSQNTSELPGPFPPYVDSDAYASHTFHSQPIYRSAPLQQFAEATHGIDSVIPILGTPHTHVESQSSESEPWRTDDELPDYAQSQREAATRARREALTRAAELERRWAASHKRSR